MTLIDDKESPIWQKLYKAWLAQGKPGTVVIGGTQYKVLRPNDDDIKFDPKGGFDSYYGSQSKGLGNE